MTASNPPQPHSAGATEIQAGWLPAVSNDNVHLQNLIIGLTTALLYCLTTLEESLLHHIESCVNIDEHSGQKFLTQLL